MINQSNSSTSEPLTFETTPHAHAGVSVEQPAQRVATCDGEQALNSLKRWMKIRNDYKNSSGFDISKLSEIYDNIKFDMLHNPERSNKERSELLLIVQMLCRAIVPFEFGLTT